MARSASGCIFRTLLYINNNAIKKDDTMHMQDLQFLQAFHQYPSISILIRTHRDMPEREKDPIKVKNAVDEAKERLLKEYSEREMKSLFERLDNVAKSLDYKHMLDGLAIFVNEDWDGVYRLPFPIEDRVHIDNGFTTRDITRTLNRIPRYWVLALGAKPTRLYYGVGDTLTEATEPEVDHMGELKDGFPYEYTGANRDSVIMAVDKGHRDSDYKDDHISNFFRKVDELLHRFISVDPLPLILVGEERNVSFFKHVTDHSKYIAGVVSGEYNREPKHKLASRVWEDVQEYLEKQRENKLNEFHEAIGTGSHTFGLNNIWWTARQGRVKDLLVEEGYAVPGVVNPDNPDDLIVYEDHETPGISDDLVDILVEKVIEKGGAVTFVKKGALHDYDHIAAILRY